MRVPQVTTTTLLSAAASGSYTYDLRGVDRASLQLKSTLTVAATCVITLTCSNDGTNFIAFPVAKTVTFTGGTTDNAIFLLGALDYAYLRITAAAPSGGTITLTGTINAVATLTQGV